MENNNRTKRLKTKEEKKSHCSKELLPKPENPAEYKYHEMDKTMLKPGCEKIARVLADDLLLWADQPDTISIDGFIIVSKMSTPRLYQMAELHPFLKQAIEDAKYRIGYRREQNALKGLYNPMIVMKTMPLYNSEYKAWYKESNKTIDITSGGTRFVIMDTMPSSDLVPEKKDDE
jgi:hypothetical protein